jgi:hypothetical protein
VRWPPLTAGVTLPASRRGSPTTATPAHRAICVAARIPRSPGRSSPSPQCALDSTRRARGSSSIWAASILAAPLESCARAHNRAGARSTHARVSLYGGTEIPDRVIQEDRGGAGDSDSRVDVLSDAPPAQASCSYLGCWPYARYDPCTTISHPCSLRRPPAAPGLYELSQGRSADVGGQALGGPRMP